MNEPLKIYFDERWIAQHGIGRFASEVMPRLKGVSPCRLQSAPLSMRSLVDTTWFLRKRERFLFSPGFNGCLAYRSRMCLTIHDLIHLQFPQERSTAKSLYYASVVRPVTRSSPCVFTVSEHAKSSIVNWSGLPDEQVIVVQNGLSETFSPRGDIAKYKTPYFFYVGNWKSHKNVSVLLHALKRIADFGEYRLICSGRCHHDAAEILRETQLPDHKISFLGPVDDATLAAHYRGAMATVVPSKYEGFGFPVLEAMGCGCPVISSNSTSLPEVGGDVPLYFNPDSLDELVDHMRSLITGNINVNNLRNQGMERSKLFTWDAVVNKIHSGLDRITSLGANL